MIKFIYIILLTCSLFTAKAQHSAFKPKRFAVFAGIGLTNAFENNSTNSWPGFTNVPFKFVSKPSIEIGFNHVIPIIEDLVSFKSEFAILTGRNVQNASINGFTQPIVYDNKFEAISVKSLAEFNMPLINENEYILFGFGPSLYFTSSDSKTELIVDSYNVGDFKYSNKFSLGAKIFIGLSRNNSVIKFNYNYLKLNSQSRDIPFAPFYTLGITYEHKIF
jgi:hypothetical protein